ncbi:MAG: hypothetical protein AB8I08_27800 [Sandaracinaceae bacterium]
MTPLLQNAFLRLALVTALLTGCGEDAADEAETPSAAETPAAEAPEPEPEPTPARPTRIVTGEAVEARGEEGRFRFRLTNQGEQAMRRAQAWVYYYDAEGSCLGRYPHAFFASIDPGASAEQDLGHPGERVPEGTASADVEISGVTFTDGTQWSNENLVQGRRDRVPGGLNHEQLLAREGELITGEWTGEYGGDDNRPALVLHNTTDEALEPRVVWVYYYNAEGGYEGRDVLNLLGDTIAPGGEHRLFGGDPQAEMDEDMRYIEVAVSGVERADGTRWDNRNLSSPSRPMTQALAAE